MTYFSIAETIDSGPGRGRVSYCVREIVEDELFHIWLDSILKTSAR